MAADELVLRRADQNAEVEMAELLCGMLPSLDMVRLVSSGTEATMSAIRLARGFTGCDLLIKFEGCYHGHSDGLLVKAGSGLLTFGNPSSGGVPADVAPAHAGARLQRRRPGRSVFAEHGAHDRGGDRRAGRRQHELIAPQRRASSKPCAR